MKLTSTSQKAAALLCAGLSCGIAAQAQAQQTSVQIYGLVGTYLGSVKHSDTTGRTLIEGNGGLTTSYLGFRGTEDLGDGLKAIFQLENFFQTDTGGGGRNANDPQFASRSSWVGLKGSFGQVTFGRHTTPYYLAMQAVNPFQSSVNFSPLVVQSYTAAFSNTISGDTVWSNGVQYITPEYKGFTATVLHSLGEAAGDNAMNNTDLSVRYVNGPLVATAVAQVVKEVVVAPSNKQTAYLGGLSYDLGPVKLYGSAQATDRNITHVKSTTYQIGASIPVTPPSQILVSWARTSNRAPAIADTTRNTASLGYDYWLSKRTDLYAIYLYDKLSARDIGNTYALGLRHTF